MTPDSSNTKKFPNKPTCIRCVFCWSFIDWRGKAVYECRRNPPSMMNDKKRGIWPSVHVDDGCGKFKRDDSIQV